LKRGALRGNEFELTLREFEGDAVVLEARLRALAAAGAPSYFGPQRFGREGRNLTLANAWFRGEGAAPDRPERGFALSAARSAVFNAVLAERVREQSWNTLEAGDVANLDGSGSIFAVAAADDVLHARAQALDVHATGPLWGAGVLTSAGRIAALEQEVARRFPALAEGLARAGLEQERRALRMRVQGLEWVWTGADVQLRFQLPRGAFATAVLHELIENAFEADAPDAGD
jgi:tRNA pseudouridine13 synthase